MSSGFFKDSMFIFFCLFVCSSYCLGLIFERIKSLKSCILLFLGTLSPQFDFKHLEELSLSLQGPAWFSVHT